MNIAQISIHKNDTYAWMIFGVCLILFSIYVIRNLTNTSVCFKKIYLEYKQNFKVDNQN